jgi:hypothetical protein
MLEPGFELRYDLGCIITVELGMGWYEAQHTACFTIELPPRIPRRPLCMSISVVLGVWYLWIEFDKRCAALSTFFLFAKRVQYCNIIGIGMTRHISLSYHQPTYRTKSTNLSSLQPPESHCDAYPWFILARLSALL